MSSPKCPIPQYPDDPNSTSPVKKYYLVTGANVRQPGVYHSWPSADAQYKKVSAATLKGYEPAEWPALEAAWQAACDRGEHRHVQPRSSSPSPATPIKPRGMSTRTYAPPPPVTSGKARATPQSDRAASPRAASRRPSAVPLFLINSRSPSPTAALPSSPPIIAGPASRVAPAGRRAYAVRCQGRGEVFDEYQPARDHYHSLQHLGEHPVLAIRDSLTAAVCFIEEEHPAPDAAVRAHWIREELGVREGRASSLMASSTSDSEESDLELSSSEADAATSFGD
ncbi:hypothetical protein B0H13DRAFT_2321776 [Mycena leptocephala]|nr:hypothetical protein B0H13DRAFT_2321776 [Mycena leptocephala]